jgi:hypothetical protein
MGNSNIEVLREGEKMTITDEIDNKISEFIGRTGKEPTSIYLGKSEWNYLMGWAKNCCQHSYPLNGKDIPEYKGKQIFQVIADSHLGIG